MLERFARLPQSARLALASVCAAAAVSGCAEAQPQPDKPALQMERCFDAPLPVPSPPKAPDLPSVNDPDFTRKFEAYEKAYAQYNAIMDPPHITMHTGHHNFLLEEKFMPRHVENGLKEGNVMVLDEVKETKGSGFLTNVPNGAGVVAVTSAHVVVGNDINRIRVVNHTGQEVGVADACYVFEKDGDFIDFDKIPEDGADADVDLAILSLQGPLDGTALKLADDFPQRGEWVKLVNNQGGYEPTSPAIFSGFVVSRDPNLMGNAIITGVQPWRRDIDGMSAYTLKGGGSGGLATNMEGEVVGVTYTASEGYWDKARMKSLFGIEFEMPHGNETGLVPTSSSVVGVNAIRQALESKRYRT